MASRYDAAVRHKVAALVVLAKRLGRRDNRSGQSKDGPRTRCDQFANLERDAQHIVLEFFRKPSIFLPIYRSAYSDFNSRRTLSPYLNITARGRRREPRTDDQFERTRM